MTKAKLVKRWHSWDSGDLRGGAHAVTMTRIFSKVAIMRRFGVSKVEVLRNVDIDRLMSFCHFVASMLVDYG